MRRARLVRRPRQLDGQVDAAPLVGRIGGRVQADAGARGVRHDRHQLLPAHERRCGHRAHPRSPPPPAAPASKRSALGGDRDDAMRAGSLAENTHPAGRRRHLLSRHAWRHQHTPGEQLSVPKESRPRSCRAQCPAALRHRAPKDAASYQLYDPSHAVHCPAWLDAKKQPLPGARQLLQRQARAPVSQHSLKAARQSVSQ